MTTTNRTITANGRYTIIPNNTDPLENIQVLVDVANSIDPDGDGIYKGAFAIGNGGSLTTEFSEWHPGITTLSAELGVLEGILCICKPNETEWYVRAFFNLDMGGTSHSFRIDATDFGTFYYTKINSDFIKSVSHLTVKYHYWVQNVKIPESIGEETLSPTWSVYSEGIYLGAADISRTKMSNEKLFKDDFTTSSSSNPKGDSSSSSLIPFNNVSCMATGNRDVVAMSSFTKYTSGQSWTPIRNQRTGIDVIITCVAGYAGVDSVSVSLDDCRTGSMGEPSPEVVDEGETVYIGHLDVNYDNVEYIQLKTGSNDMASGDVMLTRGDVKYDTGSIGLFFGPLVELFSNLPDFPFN